MYNYCDISIHNRVLLRVHFVTSVSNSFINEPPLDKTNKMICAPNEDTDQPGHPPSLIGVFAIRMKKDWVLYSYTLSAERSCELNV